MGLSIFEKISVIFEMFIHTPFSFLFLLFAIAIATSLLANLYGKKKYLKFLFPVLYVLFIIILISQFHTQIWKGIQLFIDDLFFQIYFPSIALYIFILTINFVVLVVSLWMKKITKYSKIINIISFSVLQLLFSLFLFTIREQHLVLTDWATLYQNTKILSVLEVSISVFAGWILLLIIGLGFHMINKNSDKKEEGVVISYDGWKQLDYLVKENILKLSEEVEDLKKQLVIEKEQTSKELMRIEQKLEQSNAFFIQKLKTTTSGIKSSVLLTNIQELQSSFEHNQRILKKQLEHLQVEPMVSSDYVKQQVQLLEELIEKNNTNLEKQMHLLQTTPMHELNQMKEQVHELEMLMKRYMTEMNYQLVQTRKEIMIHKQ